MKSLTCPAAAATCPRPRPAAATRTRCGWCGPTASGPMRAQHRGGLHQSQLTWVTSTVPGSVSSVTVKLSTMPGLIVLNRGIS